MNFRESRDRQVDIFHLEGEIDLDHAPALREQFQTKADQHCPALVVDLSGVSLIDSTGISVLLEYLGAATSFSGRLCVVSPTNHVRTVFEMTRINTVVPIFNSVAEAAEALCGPAVAPSTRAYNSSAGEAVPLGTVAS